MGLSRLVKLVELVNLVGSVELVELVDLVQEFQTLICSSMPQMVQKPLVYLVPSVV